MPTVQQTGSVLAVCLKAEPGLPKHEVNAITLVENHGVEGDYHAGEYVRHRYLAKKDPTRINLRQLLLADTLIFQEVAKKGIELKPGMLGENMVLEGVNVMELPIGALIEIGDSLLEITEIRNPCHQLSDLYPGLLKAVVSKENGVVRKNAGMMAKIIKGGKVKTGMAVRVLA